MTYSIRPFSEKDIPEVKKFTDQEIGEGYYSTEELIENQQKSRADKHLISSFILVEDETQKVKGLRLAYAPGKWQHGKGSQLRSDLWPYPLHETAYFQSLFLASDVQGQGWGPVLSEKSIAVFKQLGAKGIATHSWKESPNNSSVKYLEKVGFKRIIEHPHYWIDVDYTCTLDGKPCRCTAVEMYLTL